MKLIRQKSLSGVSRVTWPCPWPPFTCQRQTRSSFNNFIWWADAPLFGLARGPFKSLTWGVISVHMPGLDRTSRLRDARSNGSCGLTSLNWWPHQSDLVATLFHISVPNRFRLRNARSTGSCVLGRGVWAAEDLVAKLYRGGGQFFLQEPHRRPWSTIRFLGHFMGLWTQVHRAALQPNSYICRLGSRFLYAGASLREVRPLHLLYSLLSFMAKWKPCLSRRVFLTSVRDKSILYTPRLWAGKME